MINKTKRLGPKAVTDPGQKKTNVPSSVRVYSASSGAVQAGTQVLATDGTRKPTWQRDDIDYDCYLTD